MKSKVVLLLFVPILFFTLLACSSKSNILLNPSLSHHTEDGFTNPHTEEPGKSFFTFLKMRYFSDEPWADHPTLADQVPVQPIVIENIHAPSAEPQISWLGHSTFLIQYQGINILTDPIFSDFASPVSFAGPKRYVDHVLDYNKLPDIDFVVISHNHYDHLDESTVETLGNEVTYFVPLGLKSWFLNQGVTSDKVIEMDWWMSEVFTRHSPGAVAQTEVEILALPSQHWSARGLFDRFDSLWASWSITIDGWKVWFAGDTGYNTVQFKEIGEKAGEFDLALIPIGAYAPRWFMKTYHVNPEEAVKIHQDIRAKQSIGMHWGAFPLTAEEPGEPPIKLKAALQNQGLTNDEFVTLSVGETRTFQKDAVDTIN